MTWSLAMVDDGITNALQRRVGKPTAVEYDYYYGFVDTDDGVADTHGNLRLPVGARGVARLRRDRPQDRRRRCVRATPTT